MICIVIIVAVMDISLFDAMYLSNIWEAVISTLIAVIMLFLAVINTFTIDPNNDDSVIYIIENIYHFH